MHSNVCLSFKPTCPSGDVKSGRTPASWELSTSTMMVPETQLSLNYLFERWLFSIVNRNDFEKEETRMPVIFSNKRISFLDKMWNPARWLGRDELNDIISERWIHSRSENFYLSSLITEIQLSRPHSGVWSGWHCCNLKHPADKRRVSSSGLF